MPKYSHQFLIAITITNETEDPEAISKDELLQGLYRRGHDINRDESGIEAFQHNDTEEI